MKRPSGKVDHKIANSLPELRGMCPAGCGELSRTVGSEVRP
ncbi:hypothetical protein THTE_0117 [Thermogutta terrifontis]|uniref:Uncharacterized protein n=1 Tax=Thermogutta terrifontis TaxID=1331910 RepID=A0A286R9S6_9BACT|nr:hypothetical protein THTE_0117 [Thermogutta terrifontis]